MKQLKWKIAAVLAVVMMLTSAGSIQAADAYGYEDSSRAPSATPAIALGVVAVIAIAAVAAKSGGHHGHSGHSSGSGS